MQVEFDNDIEEKYKALSEQEKEEIFKEHIKTSILIFLLESIVFIIGGIYLLIGGLRTSNSICIVLSIFILCSGIFLWVYFIYSFRGKNASKNKEIIIKRILKRSRNVQQRYINEMNSIRGREIKKAKIIDSYTEYSDKLHAVLNYQEIIQHRIYKFLVTYVDNSTEILSVEEESELYNKLILYIDKEEEPKYVIEKQSVADEILKYKQLLDAGAINQEEYEKKKKKLLDD